MARGDKNFSGSIQAIHDRLSAPVQKFESRLGTAVNDILEAHPEIKGYLEYKGAIAGTPEASTPPEPIAIPNGVPNSALDKDQLGLADPTAEELKYQETFDSLIGDLSETASSMMKGELPQELQDQIVSMGAEKGAIYGLGDTGTATRSLTMRDLGIASVDYMVKGADIALSTSKLVKDAESIAKDYRINTQSLLNELAKTEISKASFYEAQRQYDLGYNLEVAKISASVAQFGMEMGFRWSSTPQKGTAAPESLSLDITNILADLATLKV